MNQRAPLLFACAVSVALTWSCDNPILGCQSLADCDPGQVCSKSGQCVEDPTPDPLVCEAGGDTQVLSALGIAQNARHFVCDLPEANPIGPHFSAADGPVAIVNGGSIVLNMPFTGLDDLAGKSLVFAFEHDGIVFVKDLAQGPVYESPLRVELFALRNAPPGINNFRIGIEDGNSDYAAGRISVGPYFSMPLTFIPVRGGDVQVSISWDNSNDVDLHVTDPQGFEIYYAARESPSGGALDLDSNVGCNPGPQNENIYWPTGVAPAGDYKVQLHLYTSCTTTPTSVRVTVLLHEEQSTTFDVSLQPTTTGDGTNPLEEVTTFSFP